MSRSVKILLAVGAMALAVLIVCLSILLVIQSKKPTWQEQYDLGIRYLSEGNYQEAIIAFTAAIDIDPKRPEAYQKAAEAYEAIGDSEAAKEILEKGYAATGDESLFPREETPGEESLPPQEGSSGDKPLLPQQEAAGNESLPQQDAGSEEAVSETEWTTANFIRPEELTFGGIPFYQQDIYTAVDYFNSTVPPTDSINEIINGEYSLWTRSNPRLGQGVRDDVLDDIRYFSDDIQIQPEFRNIHMGISLTEVLENLGFSPDFTQRLQSIYAGDYSDAEVNDEFATVTIRNYDDPDDIQRYSGYFIKGRTYIQCSVSNYDGPLEDGTMLLTIGWKIYDDSPGYLYVSLLFVDEICLDCQLSFYN